MEDGRQLLDAESTTAFRGLVARANYMAQDRAELQYPVKELCRCMSAPDNDVWGRLKRLVRYLVGRPRAVMQFKWQAFEDVLDVDSDANWAGCRVTRKSTSGVTLLWGKVCLRSYSSTQATISQSSAESELIALVRATISGSSSRSGACRRLGGARCGFKSNSSEGSLSSQKSWAPEIQRI